MKMRQILAGIGAVAMVAAALTACSGGGGSSSGNALDGKVAGSITVLTNRTDIVDTTFKKYASEFEKAYPGTTVKFQAITNYETDVTTRLTSHNAGDVLLIPTAVAPKNLSAYFEPLGKESDLSKTYNFLSLQTYNGTSYGIPTFANTMGFVYNKAVWKKAGITTTPATTDEFLADLKLIKDKTTATPYYTNYKDQWPLSQWNGDPSVYGKADAVNALNADKSPWSSKTYVNISDNLLFDIVKNKLSEADPTTTAWEGSKGDLAQGKIATMYLGSWAITQMQDAAKTAGTSPDDIGYMPFPQKVDGKYVATVAPDYLNGISKTSTNKATAYAWAKWFALKSGYAAANGAISPAKNATYPSTLADFTKLGVKYLQQDPPVKGKESLQSTLMKASQIDLSGGVYRQKLVDVARSGSMSKSAYFASLDKAWSDAVSSAG